MVRFGDSRQAGSPRAGTAAPARTSPVPGTVPSAQWALGQYLLSKETVGFTW